jgi:hypothetical protein
MKRNHPTEKKKLNPVTVTTATTEFNRSKLLALKFTSNALQAKIIAKLSKRIAYSTCYELSILQTCLTLLNF